jgi:hypothetical protein
MKIFYYIIQWTWGIVMNIIGLCVFLFAKIKKYETYKYRNAICIVAPKNFGGVELGMFFMRGKDNQSVCPHEYGHGIQNLWWGPLFPFVIAIPSAFRYWVRNFKNTEEKKDFATTVFVIALIPLCIITILSLCLSWLAVAIIGFLLICYLIGLFFWMMLKEIPKYNNYAYVPYDSIWFEGQATNLGTRANKGEWSWL